MREYELVMILSPEATEAEARETVSRITEVISEGGGNISQQDNWGVRRLAYPIQRFIEGNYFITRCTMEAQSAVELNNMLNSAQDVLRHLVFRFDKSELAAMEKQAGRERAAVQESERRAGAERDARARDEARRAASAAAQAARAETQPAPTAPVRAETPTETQPAPTAPVRAETPTETQPAPTAPAQAETPTETQPAPTAPAQAEAPPDPAQPEPSGEVEQTASPPAQTS